MKPTWVAVIGLVAGACGASEMHGPTGGPPPAAEAVTGGQPVATGGGDQASGGAVGGDQASGGAVGGDQTSGGAVGGDQTSGGAVDGGGTSSATGGDQTSGGALALRDAGLPDSGPADVRGTGPGDWTAGDYPEALGEPTFLEISGVVGQKGYTRGYKVHVPPGYDPQTPTPALLCFHGLGQDAVMFCVNGSEFVSLSDAEGFILIMPNGYQSSWNGGSCCGAASNEALDDVALIRAIVKEVGSHVNLDLDRIYATGLSNGAYMSFRLACDAADLVAAVAPGAGAIGKNDIGGGTNPVSDFTECKPSRPVSVLAMHGTADGLIPYSLAEPSLDHLGREYGCGNSTSAATLPASTGDTTCISYDGCPEGAALTLCTVQGGGHVWFGDESCGTGAGPVGCGFVGTNSETMNNSRAAWEFLKTRTR